MSCPQQHPCRLLPHRMPNDRDLAWVKTPSDRRNFSLDDLELLQNAFHVVHA